MNSSVCIARWPETPPVELYSNAIICLANPGKSSSAVNSGRYFQQSIHCEKFNNTLDTYTIRLIGAFDLSKTTEIVDMIKTILKHQAMLQTEVDVSSELYDDGIGLDSLCVAELSAMLEKAYGSDPYSSKIMPRTVGDIVSFYGDS